VLRSHAHKLSACVGRVVSARLCLSAFIFH
jgi:hypothetical protein